MFHQSIYSSEPFLALNIIKYAATNAYSSLHGTGILTSTLPDLDWPQVDFGWEKRGRIQGGRRRKGKIDLFHPQEIVFFGANC